MKTIISNKILHSMLIEEEDLTSLFDYLKSKYEKVEITAECTGGTVLETNQISEIISFENPNYRKIFRIVFSGRNDSDNKISLNIYSDRNFSSADYQLNSENDEEALSIVHGIISRLNETKPWYEFFVRVQFSFVISLILFAWGQFTTFEMILKSGVISDPAYMLTWSSINILIMVVLICAGTIYLTNKVQYFLFPRVFFDLGRQKRVLESINKWRHGIFVGILGTIILGVIVNYISSFLLK